MEEVQLSAAEAECLHCHVHFRLEELRQAARQLIDARTALVEEPRVREGAVGVVYNVPAIAERLTRSARMSRYQTRTRDHWRRLTPKTRPNGGQIHRPLHDAEVLELEIFS